VSVTIHKLGLKEDKIIKNRKYYNEAVHEKLQNAIQR
jgi:hypothetical protein